MRVFFAIELEDDMKEYLFGIQDDIRQHCWAGNFTLRENFHLTLRFIGDQDQSQTEQLLKALKETAANMKAFELIFNKLGKFDKGNRKILWVGIEKNIELVKLYNHLESALVKRGYVKEERGFSPHITLAREVRLDSFEEMADKYLVDNLAIRVKSISLMESTRINDKLCYVAIAREKLT